MSTQNVQATSRRDIRLRIFIILLAAVSVVGSGLAWRNLCQTAELQLRLLRASESAAHAKEMNLAAAGSPTKRAIR
jgi:hypothetical protein